VRGHARAACWPRGTRAPRLCPIGNRCAHSPSSPGRQRRGPQVRTRVRWCRPQVCGAVVLAHPVGVLALVIVNLVAGNNLHRRQSAAVENAPPTARRPAMNCSSMASPASRTAASRSLPLFHQREPHRGTLGHGFDNQRQSQLRRGFTAGLIRVDPLRSRTPACTRSRLVVSLCMATPEQSGPDPVYVAPANPKSDCTVPFSPDPPAVR